MLAELSSLNTRAAVSAQVGRSLGSGIVVRVVLVVVEGSCVYIRDVIVTHTDMQILVDLSSLSGPILKIYPNHCNFLSLIHFTRPKCVSLDVYNLLYIKSFSNH